MPQNIFKIYDGRTNFWQWDRGQKLIVLDESITNVHFSNRNMIHSVNRDVYVDIDGVRVCSVPDDLLKMPANLVAYAMAGEATVKSVKFAVVRRPLPSDYVPDPNDELHEIERRLEILEQTMRDVELGKQELHKFESVEAASQWARENQKSCVIVVVNIGSKWVAHMVEDDYSVTPICNCNGEIININYIDGGDGDGHAYGEDVHIWDGGGAAGY